jgi:hypothetical protein
MFINKKLLLALACTPLFTACIVSGDDDDTAGNTDTDPTTSATVTATTTAGTEDTSASATVATTVGTDSESGGSTAADTAGDTTGDTDTGGGGLFCQPGCEEAADCCTEGDKMCAADPASYPYTWSCDANICTYGGCSADTDCEDGGLAGYVCSQVDGVGYCEAPCDVDADCDTALPGTGYVCLDDGNGGLTCQPGPCEVDTDCGPALFTCEADGSCTFTCATDADCGVGTCDVATGACGCATDTDCGEGYTCAE